MIGLRPLLLASALLGLGSCMSVRRTPLVLSSGTQPAEPVEVPVFDTGAYTRGLQAALVAGFRVVNANAPAGMFSVERVDFDVEMTERWASRAMVEERVAYFRRLTITAVVGKSSATVSPLVTQCREATCYGPALADVTDEEQAAVNAIVDALTAPRRSPPQDASSI